MRRLGKAICTFVHHGFESHRFRSKYIEEEKMGEMWLYVRAFFDMFFKFIKDVFGSR